MIHDTPDSVLRQYEAMMAGRGPSARLRMALDMYDSMRAICRAGILRAHPDASEAEIQKLLFLRFYEDDLPQPLIERILQRIDGRFAPAGRQATI